MRPFAGTARPGSPPNLCRGPPKLTARQKRRIPTLLLRGALAWGFSTDLWTTARIAEVIQRAFGVRYHPTHVGRLLFAWHWSCQKPERRALERDEQAIARWLDRDWPAKKKARRLNAHLVLADESGFQWMPTVRRTWAPRGQTPVIRHWARRDNVSAISALTISPRRQHVGFDLHVHPGNLTTTEVAMFIRQVLRHLRGSVVLVWDQGPIHHGPAMRHVRRCHRRLHVYEFPSYAPELNPDEHVWAYAKGVLANGRPLTPEALFGDVVRVGRQLHQRPALLRSFLLGSKRACQ